MNVAALLAFLTIALEALPISSSGHLALLAPLIGSAGTSLDMLLHVPFLLSLAIAFYDAWWPLARRALLLARRAHWYAPSATRFASLCLRLVMFIFCIDSLTFIGYLLLRAYPALLASWSLSLGFAITGCALLALVWLRNNDSVYTSLNFRGSLILGITQAASLLPGVSRFGTTFAVARLLRISPRRAIELSFLMQVPLIIGGACLAAAKREEGGGAWMSLMPGVLLGTLIATVLLMLMRMLAEKRKVWLFGVYASVPFILSLMQ